MSNFSPVSSIAVAPPPILNRDSESGVRLMHTAIFMAKKDSLPRLVILLVLAVVTRASAQVVETPLAFDSASKVRSLTPTLVVRLGLKPPTWPVQAEFNEARL